MSERIRYELLLTGLSLVMGGWLMIVYDSLRLLRLLIHHNSLFMGMEVFFLLDLCWRSRIYAAV